MKLLILLTGLLLSPLATLHAADEPSSHAYDQLVQQRLREGLDAIARSPIMSAKKENIGQDIWKALLLLNENKNIEEAERYALNFCGKPLTEYVGKPVAQSRNEAAFRIYLTEKTRRLLSPKTKTGHQDVVLDLGSSEQPARKGTSSKP
jgi:hypothetical protein